MHKKFNETIRRAGFPALEALEKELSDDYTRFTGTKSLRFNLAYAEGFEALTSNAVKHMMEPDSFGDKLPVFMQMVEWHFVEELEHRTVAFDVYDHVCGGNFYRLVVEIWAQWQFTSWIRPATKYMLKANPQPQQAAAKTKTDAKATEVVPQIKQASVGNLMPSLLDIYLPNYHPHDIEISPGIQVLADKYTDIATKFS